MNRKITIVGSTVGAIGLLGLGLHTGVLQNSVLPAVKKGLLLVPPRLWAGLLFKFLVLTGAMGFITRKTNEKRERVANGEVDHSADENYTLIVGYDSQTRPLIKRLLVQEGVDDKRKPSGWWSKTFHAGWKWCREMLACCRYRNAADRQYRVVLITDRDVRKIRAEMATELTKDEIKRVRYMRRDLAAEATYVNLRIRGAREIYLMGDEGTSGRDGVILRASEAIAAKAASETGVETDAPIKTYLQFEDSGIYSQLRTQELSMDRKDADGRVIFDLEVFNYYDSWVWKCWSEKDSSDGVDPYLPLRFKPDAERVEVFVVGSGKAMKAVVDSAIMLMNYGYDSRRCRLTVVSDRAHEVLPPEDAIAAFPELEIVACATRDFGRKVAVKMAESAADEKCAVTVVIAEDEPEESVKAYLGLPFAVRSKDMSVLLWMGAQSRNLPLKPLIRVKGDRTRIRYFGMSDRMPWADSNRLQLGIAVNYYYSDCYGDQRLPKGVDVALVDESRKLWDEKKAVDDWNGVVRWAKWSSMSSADCFKEKMALVAGRSLTPEIQLLLLKAEHNRWWTERLLDDWRLGSAPDGKKDPDRRLHPNLVPFEALDEFTKDIDKLCIAAMARQGFL